MYHRSKLKKRYYIEKENNLLQYCNKTRQSEHFIMWHKWEADYDVAVKLTSVTDDVLKSNNGAYGLVNFNAHFIITECDEYKL